MSGVLPPRAVQSNRAKIDILKVNRPTTNPLLGDHFYSKKSKKVQNFWPKRSRRETDMTGVFEEWQREFTQEQVFV